MEIWKDIKGFEGKYQVSNYGNVKSLNYNRTGKERLLKQNIDKYSYHNIHLYSYGKDKRFLIHRIVAEAFIPNPDNLPYVNHKDENKHNNHVDNLEWCTQLYNLNYGSRNERIRKSLSKKVYQYTIDGKFVKEWESAMECGRNGFNQQNIVSCCRGGHFKNNKWVNITQHKGYRWSYEKKESNFTTLLSNTSVLLTVANPVLIQQTM